MDKKTTNELIKKAAAVMKNSYSPYSNYKVGAAVLFEDGKIYTGTNVENASYGGTVCAERNAVFNAVSNGQRKIKALAVATKKGKTNEITGPCGICLQVISEFAEQSVPVFLAQTDAGEEITVRRCKLKDLYPRSFTKENLR
jgi:cytidine deaminase